MNRQLGLHKRQYHIHDVAPYINWSYFFHAWGFQPKYATLAYLCSCESCLQTWVQHFPEEERAQGREAVSLWKDAQAMLRLLDADYCTRGHVGLFACNSRQNTILLYPQETPSAAGPPSLDPAEAIAIPLLRQQSGEPPFLCLADFIRPLGQGMADTIGLFCTTADARIETLFPDDAYRHLLVQTLADRLAEATAEKLHEEVRKTLWGYAPHECLTPTQMNNEKYQGIRPAIGYPSLPDISLNCVILPLIQYREAGISLTSHAMMRPHASVSGFMISHPQSRYFSVGTIGTDQWKAYAALRHTSPEEIQPFLAANLK